jgi:hypothetical protein
MALPSQAGSAASRPAPAEPALLRLLPSFFPDHPRLRRDDFFFTSLRDALRPDPPYCTFNVTRVTRVTEPEVPCTVTV